MNARRSGLLATAAALGQFLSFPCASLAAGPTPQPALQQLLGQSGSYTAQTLGLQNQAPSRHLMTVGATGTFAPTYSTYQAGTLYTFQYIHPIEAPAQAIRIALANGYGKNMVVASASVWTSDSYSGAILPGAGCAGTWRGDAGTQIAAMPTANSQCLQGTLTNGSAVISGLSSTAGLPTSSTMYVIGPTGVPMFATVTVTNGTTVTMSGNFSGTTGTYYVQFANLGTECKMYWDYQGAPVDTINTAGVSRGFTLPANPALAGSYSGAVTTTKQYSDLVPCPTTARADGGTKPLLMVYVTLAASSQVMGYGLASTTLYNASVAPLLGNRYIYRGHPWNNGGTDYADNPTGTGGSQTLAVYPFLDIQYITDAPGKNVANVGDSISASPSDGYSTPLMRACYLISTPQSPCEWSSYAWGGTAQNIYLENLRLNIKAANLSALVGQPLTRNDGIVTSTLAGIQARTALYADIASKNGLALGYYGAFPFTTTLDGSATNQAIVNTIRNRLTAISTGCSPSTGGSLCPSIPVLDPVAALSRLNYNGNWWQYAAMNFVASGAVAAGATTVPINAQSGAPCYAGDNVADNTTPAAIAGGATVVSSTTSQVVLSTGAVVGSGILSGDTLVCSVPGWTGSGLGYSDDNTHPNLTAMPLLQTAATTMVKQLLGAK